MSCRLSLPVLCAFCVTLHLSHARAQDQALFSQSASSALDSQFGSRNLSWILLDRSGRTLAQNWSDPSEPVPPGSLLKPFVAFAYGQQNNFVFPHVHCAGARDRCWLPRGHGTPGLEDALAQSCNAYFLSLAAHLDTGRTSGIFTHLGLAGPPPGATPAALIGLSSAWRETPLALARAYLTLVSDDARTPNRVALGMRIAARTGTGAALDSALGADAALAKTGTSSCTHHPRAAADGYSVVLYPAGQPRILLLVRMHGATGAQTSKQAAAMLRALGIGTP